MRRTLGYHLVKSGYGLWLPGDKRGHWSERWDTEIGLVEPRTLHEGDPVRQRMANERMKHPPVVMSTAMIDVVVTTLGNMIAKSDAEGAGECGEERGGECGGERGGERGGGGGRDQWSRLYRGGFVVSAAAIESTHMHLLLPYTGRNIDVTAKWIADQTTKAIRRETAHDGPVWARGSWRVYVFDQSQWDVAGRYIRGHNERAGRPADPYHWLRQPCPPHISPLPL